MYRSFEYGHKDCLSILAKDYNIQAGINMLNSFVHFQGSSEDLRTSEVSELRQGI